MSLGAEIRDARFTPVRLMPGDDVGEVDEFLERVAGVRPAMPASVVGPVVQKRRGLLPRMFGRDA